ncbi:hypothetical protein GCM10023224_17500 [Streptomonospora halophila]|uniref:Uncharacterized protein n=1 Tax=Streptomonospora halophila TaxID=427369 RepID=A0ABP9GC58_9ACTN
MARWDQDDDRRLVQTAVVGGARSDEPVSLPMDESGALRFRELHQGRKFWCGTWLGGCGGELSGKIYREKVCHFAHHPSSNECTRRYGDADSADHLYASRRVNRWLEGHGLEARSPDYKGDFEDGGTCTRVFLDGVDDLPPICIELTEDLDGYLAGLLRTGEINQLDWLIRNNPPLARELIDRNGYALRIRFKDEDLGRTFDVGTATADGRVRWNGLDECSLTRNGIRTPMLGERKRLRLAPEANGTETTPEPNGRLTALRRLLDDALAREDPQAAGRALEMIERRMAEFPEEVRDELDAKLRDLQKIEKLMKPHMRAENLLEQWQAARGAGQRGRAQQLRRELRTLSEPGNGLAHEQRQKISAELDRTAEGVASSRWRSDPDGDDVQSRGSVPSAAGEAPTEPARPASSSSLNETLQARAEAIRRRLRREGRTPTPPAGVDRNPGGGSRHQPADARTLRELADRVNARRSR